MPEWDAPATVFGGTPQLLAVRAKWLLKVGERRSKLRA